MHHHANLCRGASNNEEKPLRCKQKSEASGKLEPVLPCVRKGSHRLTWPERELVRQRGEKLYGKREEDRRNG